MISLEWEVKVENPDRNWKVFDICSQRFLEHKDLTGQIQLVITTGFEAGTYVLF